MVGVGGVGVTMTTTTLLLVTSYNAAGGVRKTKGIGTGSGGARAGTSRSNTLGGLTFIRGMSSGRICAGGVINGVGFGLRTTSGSVAIPNGLDVHGSRMVHVRLFVPVLNARIKELRFAPGCILVVSHLRGRCVGTSCARISFLGGRNIDFCSLRTLF